MYFIRALLVPGVFARAGVAFLVEPVATSTIFICWSSHSLRLSCLPLVRQAAIVYVRGSRH